jgi:predicted O-methyltransferase YrrM
MGRGELLARLFQQDPYADFPVASFALDHRGFNLPERALNLVAEVRPSRIIEIGTWKGNSAFFMADTLSAIDVPFEMVCVDTWLGSSEMWLPDWQEDATERRTGIERRHGYPTIYYQFLANVLKKGYEGSIVPFPATSNVAYEVLCRLGYTAKFIYIDGSHSRLDASNDVTNYWDLVEAGGILCGDDYNWPGVRAAVNDLVARVGYPLEIAEDHSWWVRKCE